MMNNDFQRGALTFSRGMTIFGSVILMVCVALLTVNWWNEGNWLWVAIGIAIVMVNIALVFLQFRRRKLTPPRADDD
ncbi:hypothetical protein [Gordonia rhizosphera]|uniref:Uncharacterized protein n=1 Tax=Gordonia rhizosphera NBRC 16068 TaxID=1108045 RepID=K6VQY0_9ACTN|nr:hypothetical protein [Gordonia rhizosphera]GAB89285.1 hypothetical protein GORHZ_055_00700 [Gordonia rhizosphera NBRC 16068]